MITVSNDGTKMVNTVDGGHVARENATGALPPYISPRNLTSGLLAKTKLFSLGPLQKQNYFPLANGFFITIKPSIRRPKADIAGGPRGALPP